MMSTQQQSIAFIGVGIMGRHMARHLLTAGYPLLVHNRTRAKADELVAAGAVWCDTPGEAAERADVTITIIGFPSDVEEMYLGSGELIARARQGSILIDMTTSSPSLAARIHAAASARGIAALDAPVSGGDVGARNAKLSIMVGGDEAAFERVKPILAAMGPNIVLQGGPGAGQHCKMANQIVIAGTMLGVCEGLAYATATGLDPKTVLKSISGGAAGGVLLNGLGPKILERDFAPGFMIEHFIKDMGIALEESRQMAMELRGLATALEQYQGVASSGGSREGTQALIKAYGS